MSLPLQAVADTYRSVLHGCAPCSFHKSSLCLVWLVPFAAKSKSDPSFLTLRIYLLYAPLLPPPLDDVTYCEYNRFLTRTQLWQGKSRRRKDGIDMGATARGIAQRLHGFP